MYCKVIKTVPFEKSPTLDANNSGANNAHTLLGYEGQYSQVYLHVNVHVCLLELCVLGRQLYCDTCLECPRFFQLHRYMIHGHAEVHVH